MRSTMIRALLALAVVSGASARAQEVDSTSAAIIRRLPPIDLLIPVAVNNAPQLKREQSSIKKSGAELYRARKEWMRGVTIEGASQYGSYGDQTVNQLYLGNRVGASLKISLYDLLATSDAADIYRYQMEETEFNRQTMERELRQIVIERYTAVELSGRLVLIASTAQSVAYAHQLMAEKEFQAGEIPLSEFSRIAQIATEASVRFETARSQYREAFAILENLVGVPLRTLEQPQ